MKTTRWSCPLCGNAVTLHVDPSRPPTCLNPNSHSSTRVEMKAARQEERENSRRAAE